MPKNQFRMMERQRENRLREAGLMGSMGKVACAYDNSLMESFFDSMQIEFLDRRDWSTRAELANGIFEWIEAFYSPTRRHSSIANGTAAGAGDV